LSETPTYADLTLYDVTESELVDRALLDAGVKLPEWRPQVGNTEVVLIEALSLVVSELVYAINRVPDATFESLLALYGLTRDPGAPTVGDVTFTLADTFGHLIPQGTVVRATVPSTGEEVDLELTGDVVVAEGSSTGTGHVAATQNGVSANGLTAGTVLELIDSVPYVEEVVIAAGGFGTGREIETDESFYDRGAATLGRLVTTLVLPQHFSAAALEDPAVGRATTVDLWDGVNPATIGTQPGHVTVVAADELGNGLPGPAEDALQASLADKAHAGLTIAVIGPAVTAVAVTATVKCKPGFAAAAVQANVVAALNDYLSPTTWDWGRDVYRYELISVIDQVEGVDRVATLTAPAADVAITDGHGVADAGVLTITAEA
jgi:hypothetical protein